MVFKPWALLQAQDFCPLASWSHEQEEYKLNLASARWLVFWAIRKRAITHAHTNKQIRCINFSDVWFWLDLVRVSVSKVHQVKCRQEKTYCRLCCHPSSFCHCAVVHVDGNQRTTHWRNIILLMKAQT